MSRNYEMDSFGRHSLALRFAKRPLGPFPGPLDFPACPRRHLFFRIFLARFPNSRPHRSPRHTSLQRILKSIVEQVGHARYWYVPSVLWFSSGSHMLTGLCWVGMAAAVLLVFNIWPRPMLAICFVCFLSFVSAAAEFSGYQSDGMLFEAGFLSLFLAPSGFRPGFGEQRASRASRCLSASLGMVPHLPRIRRRKSCGRRSRVAATSQHWTSITKMGRCQLGSAGTPNICPTGFTPQPHSSRSRSNLF